MHFSRDRSYEADVMLHRTVAKIFKFKAVKMQDVKLNLIAVASDIWVLLNVALDVFLYR